MDAISEAEQALQESNKKLLEVIESHQKSINDIIFFLEHLNPPLFRRLKTDVARTHGKIAELKKMY